jgi:AraC-like DNA-binding protein
VVTVVSTDGFEVKDREAFWRQAIAETFVPALVGDAGHGQVGGSIRSNWMGRLMVADVSASAQDIRRTPRLIRQADAEYFQVARVTRGVGRLTQDGQEAVLRPGDFAAYETTRPFRWSFGVDWDASVFTFPRSSVPLTEAERRLLTARRMAGAGGMTGMVSRFLGELDANTSLISATHSERLAAQAGDLIITLLSECGDDSEVVRSSAQRSLLLRIKDQIAQRLTDPGLGPAEIAAASNVSVRYLHKLFSAEELSVSEYVKQARLERCRRDLLDPRRARESIASIAFRSGFGDLSGFNRAFKSRFGVTPRDLRGRSDGPPAE